MLFPTLRTATRCLEYVRARAPAHVGHDLSLAELALDPTNPASRPLQSLRPSICAVICPEEAFPCAKEYWQHSGDGVSSRRSEFCHGLFKEHLLRATAEAECASNPSTKTAPLSAKAGKGPRRYRRPLPLGAADDAGCDAPTEPSPSQVHDDVQPVAAEQDVLETSRFLEERFGRNLDLSFLERAKSAIRRRIAGALRGDFDLATTSPLPDMKLNSRGVSNLREEDVYLYPCGMNAIFNTHQMLLAARGNLRSICFGFTYVDTLKILQKFGPGCQFYALASEADLDLLEARLAEGEKFLALFCEFPANPVLTCPDLARLRRLADQYDFAVVVDETIGTFANINVLQFADIVVSSLTKIFSGDCNVMGGSIIINPNGRYYQHVKEEARRQFEDNYWPEDVIFLERNSRDFAPRIDRVNANAEAICNLLLAHPLVKKVYYPKCIKSRSNYDKCKVPGGGYGGLLSVAFHEVAHAVAFYDTIETAKGPSLGTNFTLVSPYVILAHYRELDWVDSLGIERDLIRISVGLEETDHIMTVFQTALRAAEKVAAQALCEAVPQP